MVGLASEQTRDVAFAFPLDVGPGRDTLGRAGECGVVIVAFSDQHDPDSRQTAATAATAA